LWKNLDFDGARSLSFVGGNPDESLFAVLRFLRSAPPGWKLPVVWNSHAYSTPETMSLLNGIVDAYLPDFKYSDPTCAIRWSKVEDYPQAARRTVLQMIDQHVPVIVRILVLPGHLQCCHIPALQFLASLPISPTISIRRQYCPDWQITTSDGVMADRITEEETDCVAFHARSLGLVVIDSGWKARETDQTF
jgi:putative pyruvate formate lyase activating enzyme